MFIQKYYKVLISFTEKKLTDSNNYRYDNIIILKKIKNKNTNKKNNKNNKWKIFDMILNYEQINN